MPNIYVDLDGTLVRNDLFLEALVKYVKKHPLRVFSVLFLLFRGVAHTKTWISAQVELEADSLLYNQELLTYLETKRSEGHKVILATAAPRTYAEKVAGHLGIFDAVIASDVTANIKGENKCAAIIDHCGSDDFWYAGDAPVDRAIWAKAAGCIFVNAPKSAVDQAKAQGKSQFVITDTQGQTRAFIKEMRIYQYVKNFLIFIPLLLAHQYLQLDLILHSVLAFASFSLCASGVYFLNDLFDLQDDRKNHFKKNRPLASGDLSIANGIAGSIVLPLAAFLFAFLFLPFAFCIVLVTYYGLTLLYSSYLKKISTADVMTLAILFTIRIVAGITATGIALSSWLLAFSIFIFASLGYLKRYIEVQGMVDGKRNEGRGYSSDDSETMFSLGTGTFIGSVLILILFINSEEVKVNYGFPELLLGLSFLLLYWGNRIWLGARRKKIHDDPIVFAIKDKVSRMIGVAAVGVVLMSKYSDPFWGF